METFSAIFVDGLTGEITERPYTDEEMAEYLEMQKNAAKLEAEQTAKIEARESALTKLAALGLTQEEIEAL
jgi:hypothetical protein